MAVMAPPNECDRPESLRQFPLDVAHDLSGPLAGIGMLAVVAQDHLERGDLAAAREDLRRIAEQVRSSQVALDALGRLADPLERPLDAHPCSLDAIAQSAAAEALLSVRAQFPERRLPQIRLRPLGQARVDGGLVHVILVNLIGNALKFNVDRDEVLVEVLVEVNRDTGGGDADLVLVVSDDGAGFEVHADPEVRPSSGRSERFGALAGSGLGLGIVHRAAQRLGGRVELNSSPGKGATVRVSLPAGR